MRNENAVGFRQGHPRDVQRRTRVMADVRRPERSRNEEHRTLISDGGQRRHDAEPGEWV